ncbi:hypothetical protein Rhopal_003705-T1 [Rhodotorula paludigena]|uniref:Uncharacterized protein n=1 Tax=Rhodotorula paludigena TaxID=86838 RepID=A0AAV5GDR4_9BASI|nr:hypothetical protein Rhopal_003705-T1 [Rhodotorula paludigena]
MVTTRPSSNAERPKVPRKIVTATNAVRYSKSRMSYKREPSSGLANVQLVPVGGSARRAEAKLMASLEAQSARKMVVESQSAPRVPPASEQGVTSDEDNVDLQRKRELFSPALVRPLFLRKLTAVSTVVTYWDQPRKEHPVKPFESKMEDEDEDGASLQPIKQFAKLHAVKPERLLPPQPSAHARSADSPPARDHADLAPSPAPTLPLKLLPTLVKRKAVVESTLLSANSIDEPAILGRPVQARRPSSVYSGVAYSAWFV